MSALNLLAARRRAKPLNFVDLKSITARHFYL